MASKPEDQLASVPDQKAFGPAAESVPSVLQALGERSPDGSSASLPSGLIVKNTFFEEQKVDFPQRAKTATASPSQIIASPGFEPAEVSSRNPALHRLDRCQLHAAADPEAGPASKLEWYLAPVLEDETLPPAPEPAPPALQALGEGSPAGSSSPLPEGLIVKNTFIEEKKAEFPQRAKTAPASPSETIAFQDNELAAMSSPKPAFPQLGRCQLDAAPAPEAGPASKLHLAPVLEDETLPPAPEPMPSAQQAFGEGSPAGNSASWPGIGCTVASHVQDVFEPQEPPQQERVRSWDQVLGRDATRSVRNTFLDLQDDQPPERREKTAPPSFSEVAVPSFIQMSEPPQHFKERQPNTVERRGKCCYWILPKNLLQRSETSKVLAFALQEEGPEDFQLVLKPHLEESLRGNKEPSFKKAEGRVKVELKCQSLACAGELHFSIGSGRLIDGSQKQLTTVEHESGKKCQIDGVFDLNAADKDATCRVFNLCLQVI